MFFCMNCGAKLPDGAKFCLECGEKADPPEPEAEKEYPVVSVIPIVAVEGENSDLEDHDLDDDLGGYAAEPAKIVPPTQSYHNIPASNPAPAPSPSPAAAPQTKEEDDLDEDDDPDNNTYAYNTESPDEDGSSEQPTVSSSDEGDDDIDEDLSDEDDDDDLDEDESVPDDDDDEDDDLDEDDAPAVQAGTLHGAGRAPSAGQWIEQNGGYAPINDPYWDDILPDLEKEIYQIPKDMIFKMAGSFVFMLVLIIWLIVML